MSNPFHTFFHHRKLDQIAEAGQAVKTLHSKNTVEDAIRILHSNRIQSIPIVDDKSKQILGIVDILDLVKFVVSVAPDHLQLKENELRSLEIAGRAMAWKELGELVNFSGRDAYVPVYLHNPVTEVIDIFARGVHRTALVNEDGQVVGIVSQSNVATELAKHLHMGELKEIGQRSISSLGLGKQGVTTISDHDSVLQALHRLDHTGFSALAVVHQNGRICGNFSASDLRGLTQEHFPGFLRSVQDFLELHSPKSLAPVVVHTEASLSTVVHQLSGHHLHRVWVVDGDYKPIGVVSLTDIMRLLRDFSL